MSLKYDSDHKEPRDNAGENEDAAGVLLLNQLMHDEGVLWQQARHLRTAATELNGVGDDETAEEAVELDRKAGQLEAVAKQMGDLAQQIKLNPKKKIAATTLTSLNNAAILAMNTSDNELVEAEEVKEMADHKAHDHQQAQASHKMAPALKTKELKAKEKCPSKGESKGSSGKKTGKQTFTQKAVSYGSHIKHEYVMPVLAWGGHILTDMKQDYLDPVLHSAPVTFTVNAAKTVTNAVVNTGKAVVNVVLHPVDTMHNVVDSIADAGTHIMGRVSGAMSSVSANIYGYFAGDPDEHAHAEHSAPATPAKHSAISPKVAAQVLATKIPTGISVPKAHSVMELLTPPAVFGLMPTPAHLEPQS